MRDTSRKIVVKQDIPFFFYLSLLSNIRLFASRQSLICFLENFSFLNQEKWIYYLEFNNDYNRNGKIIVEITCTKLHCHYTRARAWFYLLSFFIAVYMKERLL